MARKAFLFFTLLFICLGGIAWLFWHQEFKYTLPTPVPADLTEVSPGDSISLPFSTSSKNVFVHFYNYDCPCSRFNIAEFKSMVRRYSGDIEFIAVLQADGDQEKIKTFKDKYDLGIRVIDDPDGKIADLLGVYSTPQAVLIKGDRVFYKGNYNRARFCISRNTKFAEIALTALINDEPPPEFPSVAFTAYGCELPSNTEQSDLTLFSFFNYGN